MPTGSAWQSLPKIDLVMISHNHYDHLDTETVQKLVERNPDTEIIVGLGVGASLDAVGVRRYREMDWEQGIRWRDMTLWFVECQHFSGRGKYL